MKQVHPFYHSEMWQTLRKTALRRDRFRCSICRSKASVVDHIVSRRSGGPDTLRNLRSLCWKCDRQLKEHADGKRGRLMGCGPDGWPLARS